MAECFSVGIPLDAEGFLALRCPQCEAPFKIRGDDARDRDVSNLYCASCGLSGEFSGVLPSDVREHVKQHAINQLIPDLNRMFGKLSRSVRPSKGIGITITFNPLKPVRVSKLRAVTDLAEAELPCCETTVKVAFSSAGTLFYCPFCGHAQT